jgi:hypothetical protein
LKPQSPKTRKPDPEPVAAIREPIKTVKQVVPQFYFPQGKPTNQTDVKAIAEAMDKIFGKAPGK